MKNYMNLRLAFACGASAIALAAASPSWAQETGFTIEELVVTAEKREQSLQDVSVAVTAYTSERRDLLGVGNVEDLARVSPSVTYTNNDRLSIRGFGRLTNSIGIPTTTVSRSEALVA